MIRKESPFDRLRYLCRWFVLVVFFLFYFIISVPITRAADQISSTYHITYDVSDNADTTVTEEVTFKNLTDKYYPAEFDLTVGSTKISDVFAQDNSGPLEVSSKNQDHQTAIQVKFNQQVAGLGKQYSWKLSYRTPDFAQHIGKIWQISIPKIVSQSSAESYQVELVLPTTFGDPTTIVPTPVKQTEILGKEHLFFNKDQLTESGILANFGAAQTFAFHLTYTLQNNGMLPTIATVNLPMDTPYQKVLIDKISPQPENVVVDQEGNYLASFKVARQEKYQVTVSGVTKVTGRNAPNVQPLTQDQIQLYTSSQKFWEKDTPQIKTKLSEIFKDKTPSSNQEKARLIHKFVSNYLQYDNSRVDKGDFTRLGALTALNNPTKALCSEFTDLFIALARAAGIPARGVYGFGYSQNSQLRPLSLQKDVLHAWPEYFDPKLGWVMIDPTWENTTGGVDYFSQFDLSHVALAVSAETSAPLWLADKVDVSFADTEIKDNSIIRFSFDVPKTIYAGFAAQGKLHIQNDGTTAKTGQPVTLMTQTLKLKGVSQFETPVIPPYGHLDYPFELKSPKWFSNYTDTLTITVGHDTAKLSVPVVSILTFNLVTTVVAVILLIIISLYVLILVLHLRLQIFGMVFRKVKKQK